MMDILRPVLAEVADSPVQEVVDQVGDMIDKAGNKAGSFLSSLPMLSTKLLMAGLAIFVGCILLRVGRRMIGSIVRMRGKKGTDDREKGSLLQRMEDHKGGDLHGSRRYGAAMPLRSKGDQSDPDRRP